MGQWILKSALLLDCAHNRAFYTSLHVSLLSIFLSIHSLLFCLSIHVNSSSHSLWIKGCTGNFLSIGFCFSNKTYPFSVLLLMVHVLIPKCLSNCLHCLPFLSASSFSSILQCYMYLIFKNIEYTLFFKFIQ